MKPIVTRIAMMTCGAAITAATPADDDRDRNHQNAGQWDEQYLSAHSERLFGFGRPLAASADEVVDRREGQPASERQLMAGGLKAEYVTRAVGGKGDMISFWPDDLNYTHLMVCNELGRAGESTTAFGTYEGQNPAVQRVQVKTGKVETILYGMAHCDGIRTTQWGTVVATEESGVDGGAYEIIAPLTTTGHWIANRGGQGAAADIRDGIGNGSASTRIVKRTALPSQSWEGLAVLDNGVVIAGDELGESGDATGGAIFRFVPTSLYNCLGAPVRPGQLCGNTISDLSQSPLAAGQNYALATVCTDPGTYGQPCGAGHGVWVEVSAANARDDANERGTTGFCRPEDLHVDRSFGLFDGGKGIRWCWNNTCGGGFGETLCVTEDAVDAQLEVFNAGVSHPLLSTDGSTPALARITRFNEGNSEMNGHDNLDIQPVTGNVYIVEDNPFGDIWACLQDGQDRDFHTEGCVRLLSINSAVAEPSGFIFDGTGEVAYYHLQHGQQPVELHDFDSNPVTGQTDDLIKITGFKVPANE